MKPLPVKLDASPGALLTSWPPDIPLAVLWSGAETPASRWTILAAPSRARRPFDSASRARLTPEPAASPPPAITTAGEIHTSDEPPFRAGWIGMLSYDLGDALEPAVRSPRHPAEPGAWPLAEWWRCDDALIFDRRAGRWWQLGNPPLPRAPGRPDPAPAPAPTFVLAPLRSATGRAAYTAGVHRALEYIRAGDVYQVNLAHELRAPFRGSSRALLASLLARSAPWYGAYLECDHAGARRALVSTSPELFLEFEPASRTVTTRPMKGTRPASARPEELDLATKDRAELTMIIDLMRNDLGRVCDFGSVRVTAPRSIERHGGASGVLQATATISGALRAGLSIDDLLRATFPAGSVTGAPKIRAMQIIDELEPTPRGPYCGCVGYISDDGHAAFSVAIRTALIDGAPAPGSLCTFESATLRYSVGAGIVADSDPDAEWRETLDKAAAWPVDEPR